MRVSIFMSENIPSAVDWYYRRLYTKLSGARVEIHFNMKNVVKMFIIFFIT